MKSILARYIPLVILALVLASNLYPVNAKVTTDSTGRSTYYVGLPCSLKSGNTLENINVNRTHSHSTIVGSQYYKFDLLNNTHCGSTNVQASISGRVYRHDSADSTYKTLESGLYNASQCSVPNTSGQNSVMEIANSDGVRVLMYHMDFTATNTANAGDFVKAGDVVGTMGAVGCASGVHLHIQVRKGTYLYNSNQVDYAGTNDLWAFSEYSELQYADEGYNPVPPTIYQYQYANPRLIADVTGDKKGDAIGFGNAGVYVSPSVGAGFIGAGNPWLSQMGTSQGWTSTKHVRTAGDFSGDGKADLIGFGDNTVWGARSTGTGFGPLTAQLGGGMSYDQGWRVNLHPRMVADVNGDKMADLVGFFNDGVHVALYNGGSFNAPTIWLYEMGYNHGWRVEKHERVMADVNGDGSADIVGFGDGAIYVALSNKVNSFSIQASPLTDMSYLGDWRVEKHPRVVADVTGDSKADAVGFGEYSIFGAPSTGTTFSSKTPWLAAFTYQTPDWRVEKHPRMVADVTGDGKADAVGFGNLGIMVGTSHGGGFNPPALWLGEMGYDAGGWR